MTRYFTRLAASKHLLLALFFMGLTTDVDADEIAFLFSGTLHTAVDGNGNPLPGVTSGLGEGQPYTGVFSFDDAAPPAVSIFADDHNYTWPVGTIAIDIGGQLYSFVRYGTPGEAQYVTLGPDAQGEPPDTFSLNGEDGPGFGVLSIASLGMIGQPGFLSSTTTLAGLRFNPSLFVEGGVNLNESFQDRSQSYDISASITQISGSPVVPEPSALGLIGTGQNGSERFYKSFSFPFSPPAVPGQLGSVGRRVEPTDCPDLLGR